MNDTEIETYLMMNEPAFSIGKKQYSVCCADEVFGTWDSDGNTFNFYSITDFLDNWIVDGKPFGEIIQTIMQDVSSDVK